MRIVIATLAVAALAGPAFAQAPASDTLKAVIAKGTVMTGSVQGNAIVLKMAYKADGTYTADVNDQVVDGKYRVDGDKLCATSDAAPQESCTTYPAGKKPGDEFEVTHPLFGAIKVKIN